MMSALRPYRGNINFCAAARDASYFERLTDAVIEAIERQGGFFESGYSEPMEAADVVPESPLALALAAAVPVEEKQG